MKPKRACRAAVWRAQSGGIFDVRHADETSVFRRSAHREKMTRKKEYRSQFRGDYYRPHPAHFEGGYGAPLERGGKKRRGVEEAYRRLMRMRAGKAPA